MRNDGADPVVWAVAGCLFEVSVPEAAGTSWTWVSPQREVTLVSESVRGDGHHFRFRAEPAGAAAGRVQLRFRGQNAVRAVVMRIVTLHIAPEPDVAELST